MPTAINAIKEGAYDYIEKPFSPEKLEQLINKMRHGIAPSDDNLTMLQRMEEKYSFENIVAKSPRMQKIVDMIKVVAKSNAPVSIYGESGTGKELVARAIHNQSYRRNKPFVAVSCAALPETLIEVEMFGQESGTMPGEFIEEKASLSLQWRVRYSGWRLGAWTQFPGATCSVPWSKRLLPGGGTEPINVDVRPDSATTKI